MPRSCRTDGMMTSQALRSAAIQLMKSAAMFDPEAISVVLRRTASPPITGLAAITNPALHKKRQNIADKPPEHPLIIENQKKGVKGDVGGCLVEGVERGKGAENENLGADTEKKSEIEYIAQEGGEVREGNGNIEDSDHREQIDEAHDSSVLKSKEISLKKCQSDLIVNKSHQEHSGDVASKDDGDWLNSNLIYQSDALDARLRSSSEPELNNESFISSHLSPIHTESIGDLTLGSRILDCKHHPRYKNSPISTACRRAVLDKRVKLGAALWDHVTMDPLELGFKAGDVLEVTDWLDRDWWWGRLDGREGWFPPSFVVIQSDHSVSMSLDGTASDSEASLQCSHHVMDWIDGVSEDEDGSGTRRFLTPQERARGHVVLDILQSERTYVQLLNNIIQGYLERAVLRPDMFNEERLSLMFGNLKQIFEFSSSFLAQLESCVVSEAVHSTDLGQCFIQQKQKFEMYSEYCSNYPKACEEIRLLMRNSKYQQFFETCRLKQEMILLTLDGFLLSPVQKICRYPLQLKELLKYTPDPHPDHPRLVEALEAMKLVTSLINERKRRMESLEQLVRWQNRVSEWQGSDLLERSSELIHSGEIAKINVSGGRSQDRVVFIFDHQLIICKKDLLWRDLLNYKDRVDLDCCVYSRLSECKEFGGRWGFKLMESDPKRSGEGGRVLVFGCRTGEDEGRWLEALGEERRRVGEGKGLGEGSDVEAYRQKVLSHQGRLGHSSRRKDKFRVKDQLGDVATSTSRDTSAVNNGVKLSEESSNNNECSNQAQTNLPEAASGKIDADQSIAESNKSTPVKRSLTKKSSILRFIRYRRW